MNLERTEAKMLGKQRAELNIRPEVRGFYVSGYQRIGECRFEHENNRELMHGAKKNE